MAYLKGKSNSNRSASRSILRENSRFARQILGRKLSDQNRSWLKTLSKDLQLSIGAGDLQIVNDHWYVTHTGLLRLARRKRCIGIQVEPVTSLCDHAQQRFAFKATVYPCKSSSGFVGFGDADPSNISPLVRGAELRVAETRAVNRALRKAYGIGLCSVEEIGSTSAFPDKLPPQSTSVQKKGNGNGPKLRDRLCQLIRQHKLDAELVKAYALAFCGTTSLREASREQIQLFVNQLADWAEKDPSTLLCELNRYARPVKPITEKKETQGTNGRNDTDQEQTA